MAGKKSNQARFPVARIKKLIQADEDVGKVAQGTPVVVSKALELFLAHLVEECVKDADERGSKKITAYGVKRTVTQTDTFDFCSDIVEGVPDPITDENDQGDGAGKKKRARKPKAAAGEGDSVEPRERKPRAKKVKDEDEEDEDEQDEEEGAGEGGAEESKPKPEDDDDYFEEVGRC